MTERARRREGGREVKVAERGKKRNYGQLENRTASYPRMKVRP